MKNTNFKYGWKPDIPDHRDLRFSLKLKPLPGAVDLRKQCPPVLDQGDLGSCTANAIANCMSFCEIKEGHRPRQPSRLFIYFNERVIEHTVKQDAGAQIRDGFKSAAKDGVCDETEWPYDVSKFAQKPASKCYQDALAHRATEYRRLENTNLAELKQCLADGFPFVFGMSVYEGFESSIVAKTGSVSLPGKTEQLLGGHAVLAVGYRDTVKRFIVQNSWGIGWGQKGYFTIPYSYLTNPGLADDFWTMRVVA